jgi:hypothetical protein
MPGSSRFFCSCRVFRRGRLTSVSAQAKDWDLCAGSSGPWQETEVVHVKVRKLHSFVALVAAALLYPAVAGSDEPAGGKGKTSVKEPSPVKALQAALKNLDAAKGYKVSVDVEGGLSETEDHRVSLRNVRENYEGLIFGSMMHVPTVKAYRTLKRGVAKVDGAWRDCAADPRTRRLEKFFAFPAILLGRALQHASETGRWIRTDEASPEPAGAAEESKPAAKPAAKTPRGKTVVVSKPEAVGGAAAVPQYRWIRIEAPPQEAVANFVEVQNSGCFGGG